MIGEAPIQLTRQEWHVIKGANHILILLLILLLIPYRQSITIKIRSKIKNAKRLEGPS